MKLVEFSECLKEKNNELETNNNNNIRD